MTIHEPGTTQLLDSWYQGDRTALDALLQRHMPWIRARVRQRLGTSLRRKVETTDIVQEAMIRLLRDGPRLRIDNEARFLALMARLVENVICDQHDWFRAQRRDQRREVPPAGEGADLACHRPGPESNAGVEEMRALVRVGLRMIPLEDREVLSLRNYQGLGFQEIGERLGIQPGAADMRYRRAARRLAKVLHDLRVGRVELPEEAEVILPSPQPAAVAAPREKSRLDSSTHAA